MMMIETRGLCKAFGKHVVLDDIDLDVAEGTIFALLGPNGAGKTTAVHILSTLIHADSGEVRVAGRIVSLRLVGKAGLAHLQGAGKRKSPQSCGKASAFSPRKLR